ncbi:MAG: DUF1553 domain-containing protein [Verrucomicrobiales bacterium]|nr:DUF1553 domain-containing protein [Verrucomicrobiales bacterium]
MNARAPQRSGWRLPVWLALFGSLAAVPAMAATRPDKTQVTRDALTVIHRQCASCHNEDKAKGGLDLTSRETALKGGDTGKAIAPGKPERSLLLSVLAADADPHMPPKKQLNPAQIESLKQWVDGGAKWDDALMAKLRAPREVNPGPLPAGFAPVRALAVSPDGTTLAVGRGRRLSWHDTSTNTLPEIGEGVGFRDEVRAMAWSADNRWMAAAGYRELRLWQVEGGKRTLVWQHDTNLVGRITALRFSPHGGALVVADGVPGDSGWVRVFGVEDGALLAAWRAHADLVNDVSISPDGGLLATAGADRLVRLWELVSRREVARLEGHAGAVTGVAFGTNHWDLVTVGADKQLKLWDLRSREAVVTISGRKHGFSAAAWASNGSRLVTGSDDGALVAFSDFRRHTGEQSSATATEKGLGSWGDALHAVSVTSDGGRVYAGGEDGRVRGVDHEARVIAQLDRVADEVPATAGTGEVPSFVADVLPRLAKAGCSAGACHAKADGQNGFKLSVFSYDPKADHGEIVKEGRGRRVFAAAPEESLLLLKATGTVEHGGGQRIEPDSETYRVVLAWLRAGLPYQRPGEAELTGVTVDPAEATLARGEERTLKVMARYSDGSQRDVTAWSDFLSSEKEFAEVNGEGRVRLGKLSGEGVVVARYMGFVDAARLVVPADRVPPAERYDALARNNFIDELAFAQLRKLGLSPSEDVSEEAFLRRSALDILGVLPRPEEIRAHLERLRLGAEVRALRHEWIDRLLARPEYADYWANKWADLLRPNPDRVGVKSIFTLDQWLRESFRANKPYDQFVREVILAEGSNHRDGPVVVYRDRREPPELATLFSQLFLGVRLECAKCHHHPNEKWSQEDFYRFAAVFGSVRQKGAGLSPPISAGTETFYHVPGEAKLAHPVTGVALAPKPPDGPELRAEREDPRRLFADWLTRPENPFFARAAVNRVWAVFFGRGFVEPVDDFRVSNPVVHAPLLEALARDFSGNGYDLKRLIRTIASSRLYQLSSTPNDSNVADTRQFSRAYRRRLPAEVLLDAVNDVTGIGDDFNGCPPGTRAVQTWSYKMTSHFMDAFGRPNPSSDCPCERDVRTSVVQALHLMNSRRLQEKLSSADGRVKQLADSDRAPAAIVEELYLTALGRMPTEVERGTAVAMFREGVVRQAAAEDVLWALLNSPEFVFNH